LSSFSPPRLQAACIRYQPFLTIITIIVIIAIIVIITIIVITMNINAS
jgi:hypothetical protein